MPWDYQSPYPGGPLVAVKGFPRVLFPPDHPTEPTPVDGSDVEAYKRGVSRAGRWLWQAFDQQFSNGFSHGSGPNLVQTGLAGVQRQQGRPDSGILDRETFNLLRSIRIPEGLAHAGEPALDARSVELINAAYDRFRGGNEPPGPRRSAAQHRLYNALSQIGEKEAPFGSNRQKYGAWYGLNGQPWCAIFATWCDQTGPGGSPSFRQGEKYAYVPFIVSDARLGRNGLKITSTPRPGTLVCYDWSRDGEFDHVGIFEAGDWQTWTVVEGNTGAGNNSNGGQVLRCRRSRGQANVVFVDAQEP